MTSFRFDIRPEWEEAIREGRKTLDVRFNVRPFADVNKGDTVEYHTTKVTIKAIRAYPGESDVIAYEDFKRIVPEAADRQEALRTLREALLLHVERTHGILVFEIEII